MRTFFCVLGIFIGLFLSGCTASQKQAAGSAATSAAQPTMQFLTFQALTKAAVKSPVATKAAATALLDNVNNALLPYVNGAPLPLAGEVSPILNSSLTKNFDPLVVTALNGVVSVADSYVALPAASKLTTTELKILQNALKGISAGAQQYLDSVAVNSLPNGATP